MAKRHTNRVGDLESLFLRLEELVLANSGEDEFEEVFKLLIAKLWDEKNSGGVRFTAKANESDTFAMVSELLSEAEKGWPGILEPGSKPLLTAEHLQVCVQALTPHRLGDEAFEIMDGLFEFLVAKGSKGAKGQYFTPRHVVELCVRILKPKADDLVLDPACGSGGFLVHALNYVRNTHGKLNQKQLVDYCANKLWGFDIDARAIRVAKALLVLAGGGDSNVIRLNSLLTPEMTRQLSIQPEAVDPLGNMLAVEDVCRSRLRHHKGFDLILTNPPFAGEVRESQILSGYDLARGKGRVERDILFVERCVDLLRPGGRLAIVLPHNKFAMANLAYTREWLHKKAKILAVIGLGRNTFLPHTHQKASVLFVEKFDANQRPSPDHQIFFGISERDGKNSKGQFVYKSDDEDLSSWDRIDHDFDEIITAYEEFSQKTPCLTEAK